MTKAELIEKIARGRDLPPDLTKKVIAQVLDRAFEELAAHFIRGKVTRSSTARFTYPGFGTFSKKRRSARRGVNPRTLEPMRIEAAYTLDFKPSIALRTALNGKEKGTQRPVSDRAAKVAKTRTAKADGVPKRKKKRRRVQPSSLIPTKKRFTLREEVEPDDTPGVDERLIEVLELPPPPLQRTLVEVAENLPPTRVHTRSGG